MAFRSRVSSAVIGVIVFWAPSDSSSALAAPIRPEKDKDSAYAKKLVGTWEFVEDAKNGGPSIDFSMEFKADGSLKLFVNGLGVALSGTWKLVKEKEKTLTIDMEMTQDGLGGGMKPQQQTLSVVFEDGDTIVISSAGERPDSRKLKRKP